jgi:diamine N-acetyltransferase
MLLRSALDADVPRIVALERLSESQKYVGQWSEERHRAALSSADARYFVSEDEAGALQAFVLLRGFEESSQNIELKRIVVAAPGRGVGRRILSEIIRIAFEEIGVHRLFLDVFGDNLRARHLYESLGFVYEGIMREAGMRDGKYYAMHLMSMLESEYRAHKAAAGF